MVEMQLMFDYHGDVTSSAYCLHMVTLSLISTGTLQEEMGVLKIADFGLSKSLKLSKSQNKGDPSSKSAIDASGGSGHAGGPAVGGKGAVEGSVGGPHASAKSVSAPAYKLTGETGSYRSAGWGSRIGAENLQWL
jgi:hypothetical protein